LLLLLLAILLALFEPTLSGILQFDRQAILAGEWWRLWSGHLLHTNSWHLLMNLAGLVVITLLHGNYYQRWQFLFLLLSGLLLISLALLFWSPAISFYVGLSGWLHTLLVYGACEDIRRNWSSGWLILAGVAAKVTWEQWHGASSDLVTLIEADVAIDAHLYGAICGLILFGALHSFSQIRSRS
jgi:rhomboid family GlyGly-CTERM serine protease